MCVYLVLSSTGSYPRNGSWLEGAIQGPNKHQDQENKQRDGTTGQDSGSPNPTYIGV